MIVFLTWLYLTAYIMLLGAELNAVLEIKFAGPSARAPEPVTEAGPKPQSPSLPAVAARMGLLSMLLALLGRPRRPIARP